MIWNFPTQKSSRPHTLPGQLIALFEEIKHIVFRANKRLKPTKNQKEEKQSKIKKEMNTGYLKWNKDLTSIANKESLILRKESFESCFLCETKTTFKYEDMRKQFCIYRKGTYSSSSFFLNYLRIYSHKTKHKSQRKKHGLQGILWNKTSVNFMTI